jgi:hypothetical protein
MTLVVPFRFLQVPLYRPFPNYELLFLQYFIYNTLHAAIELPVATAEGAGRLLVRHCVLSVIRRSHIRLVKPKGDTTYLATPIAYILCLPS